MDEQELTMKPSEVLDRAADILDRDGWHQGMYYKEPPLPAFGTPEAAEARMRAEADKANREAPCCQRGAISRAATGWAWAPFHLRPVRAARTRVARMLAMAYMDRYILDRYGHRSSIQWNDEQGRTKEEVQEALRAAAELARSEGE